MCVGGIGWASSDFSFKVFSVNGSELALQIHYYTYPYIYIYLLTEPQVQEVPHL